jgi:Lon protease-like protein
MDSLPILPIFPLHTVLFPGGVLSLKLFEARYLDMAARCLRENSLFGVCLIREGGEVGVPAEPHLVGTAARIVSWDMPQTGLLLVSARGERRFRVLQREIGLNRLQSAHIAYLDGDGRIPVPAAQAELLPLLRAIIADAGDELFPPPHHFDTCAWVAHRFAEILPIPVEARQRLLELDDPVDSLEIIHAYLHQHRLLGEG